MHAAEFTSDNDVYLYAWLYPSYIIIHKACTMRVSRTVLLVPLDFLTHARPNWS